jgi:hypothetical protein
VSGGRYDELAAKVDAFFARVASRHAADMDCNTGCADCCHQRLSITGVEASAIVAHVRAMDADARAELAALAARPIDPADARCAALGDDDRCRIYAARPIVCRSHGAPIRMRDPRSLPVVTSCHRNFTARGPAAADADCVIDQTTLSALVLAVDRDAGNSGDRVDLGDVLVTATC